jgi:hypothetical protein
MFGETEIIPFIGVRVGARAFRSVPGNGGSWDRVGLSIEIGTGAF